MSPISILSAIVCLIAINYSTNRMLMQFGADAVHISVVQASPLGADAFDETDWTAAVTPKGIHSRQVRSSMDQTNEQIRSPLIKQPTTLAPLPVRHYDTFDQLAGRGSSSSSGDQASTQEPPYLSAEEHERLMRSQESHYEGKSSTGPSDSPSSIAEPHLQSSSSRQVQQHHQRNRVPSSPDDQRVTGIISGQQTPQHLVAPTGAPNLDSDDSDYEDEQATATGSGTNEPTQSSAPVDSTTSSERQRQQIRWRDGPIHHERQQHRQVIADTANNYPSQLTSAAASYNRQQQLDAAGSGDNSMAELNNNADDVSSNNIEDDYSGANDDTYFSRKPTGGETSMSPAEHSNGDNRAQRMMLANSLENNQLGDQSNSFRARFEPAAGTDEALSNEPPEFVPRQSDELMSQPISNRQQVSEPSSSMSNDSDEDSGEGSAAPEPSRPDMAAESDGSVERRLVDRPAADEGASSSSSRTNGSDDESSGDATGDSDYAGSDSGNSDDTDSGGHIAAANTNGQPNITVQLQQPPVNMVMANQQQIKETFRATPVPKSQSYNQRQQSVPVHLSKPPTTKTYTMDAPQPLSKPTETPYNPQNNPSHAGKYFIN